MKQPNEWLEPYLRAARSLVLPDRDVKAQAERRQRLVRLLRERLEVKGTRGQRRQAGVR